MNKIDEVIKSFKVAKEQFIENVKAIFVEEAKKFFEDNPGVESIYWTQYTPYWNDGEECTFSRHDHDFTYFDDVEDKRNTEYRAFDSEFSVVIDRIPNEIYLDMFGDHVEVSISRDGINVQGYNHE